MAWCRQATSYYLNQCWPRSQTPYGITRPQWVNSLWPSDAIWWNRSGSTLVQVMACCLMSPSLYLNQCWLLEKLVKPCGIQLTAISQETIKISIHGMCLENINLKLQYVNFQDSNGPWINLGLIWSVESMCNQSKGLCHLGSNYWYNSANDGETS